MTTFDEKLALARTTTIITEAEADATGGSYFDDDMGLWIRQDADGGGIMPFAWQMASVRVGNGDIDTIKNLFVQLGRNDDIVEYDRAAAEAEAERADYGLKE